MRETETDTKRTPRLSLAMQVYGGQAARTIKNAPRAERVVAHQTDDERRTTKARA